MVRLRDFSLVMSNSSFYLEDERRGGHYGHVCVCHLQDSLLFTLLICNHLSERKYSLSLFSLFPHLSLPTFRFIRTSWDSMLTTPKQTLHSKSSCGRSLTKNFPIPSFPLRYLHSSRLACNRLRCLGLLKPEFSFSISFYSTSDPVSIASIASRTQFERLSYMHMHTLATNILAVEKKKSRHSF